MSENPDMGHPVSGISGKVCGAKRMRLDGQSRVRLDDYSSQRRKTNEPLVPPKPKELDRARSTFAFCGLLGT